MSGDDKVRACSGCNKNVFNISAMTRAEAEAFLAEYGASQCTKFYRRKDGSIMTDDCPRALRKLRDQCKVIARVAAGLIAFILSVPAVFGQDKAAETARTPARPMPVSNGYSGHGGGMPGAWSGDEYCGWSTDKEWWLGSDGQVHSKSTPNVTPSTFLNLVDPGPYQQSLLLRPGKRGAVGKDKAAETATRKVSRHGGMPTGWATDECEDWSTHQRSGSWPQSKTTTTPSAKAQPTGNFDDNPWPVVESPGANSKTDNSVTGEPKEADRSRDWKVSGRGSNGKTPQSRPSPDDPAGGERRSPMDRRAQQLHEKGRLAVKNGEYERAEQLFQKALEVFDSQENADPGYRRLLEDDLERMQSQKTWIKYQLRFNKWERPFRRRPDSF